MKKFRTNKGFSLIEMMVVVGIMGVLAMVAVPNLLKFQGKAKQANAKTELATMYGLEKAFYTEFSAYDNSMNGIGYAPDGAPLANNGCLDTTKPTLWPTRYYAVGFGDTTLTPLLPPSVPADTCAQFYVPAHLAAALDARVPSGIATVTNTNTGTSNFIIEADGSIGGKQDDIWRITDNKILTNSQIGF